MTESKPKVSVCVVTYNQENYIRECLQSIVEQKTDFSFEVVVGDDCSTDNTREIVQEFVEVYPEVVKSITYGKNIGATRNYQKVHGVAIGEYVCHVDGDDYLLPDKLTAQVRLLDSNSNLTAVFHQLRMVGADGQDTGRHWPLRAPAIFDCTYLLEHHPVVGHSSLMYRNGLLEGLLKSDVEFVDFRVYVELALQGAVGYLDGCYGVYRVGVGVSSSNVLLGHVMRVFDFAETRGVDSNLVNKGRASQLFRAALNAFYRHEYLLFKKNIEASVEKVIFSKKQMLFFKLRSFPKILVAIHFFYVVVRKAGLISDIKMDFG